MQAAQAVDFTEDAADLVKTLDRSRGYANQQQVQEGRYIKVIKQRIISLKLERHSVRLELY